jgi:uncharacterized protein
MRQKILAAFTCGIMLCFASPAQGSDVKSDMSAVGHRPAIVLSPGFEKKWAGIWTIGPTPKSDEEFHRSGPSFEFAITEVTVRGFSYTYGGNPMGYGLNWSVIMEGHASFQSAASAIAQDNASPPGPQSVPASARLLLTLEEDAATGVATISASGGGWDGGPLIVSRQLFYPAGFSYAKATTPVELAVCSSSTLARADREMNALYASLRNHMDKGARGVLDTGQVAWIRDRNGRALVGGRVDEAFLDRSYADRLATLEKQADPTLGRSPGVDAAYVAGSYGKSASLWDDSAFVLTLARSRIRKVGLTDRPALTLERASSSVMLSGSYENWDNIFIGDGGRTAWSNSFAILAQADGEIWTVEIEVEIPEGVAENGRDFEREYYRFGEPEVWGPAGKDGDSASWPASITAWLDRHPSEVCPPRQGGGKGWH